MFELRWYSVSALEEKI